MVCIGRSVQKKWFRSFPSVGTTFTPSGKIKVHKKESKWKER
jgi:hypothetical protein